MTAKVGRAESRFRNPIQTTTTLDALNVNGYSIDFRGQRSPAADQVSVRCHPGGRALTLVGVPVAASGTQPTTIANTTSSEIRIRPQRAPPTANDVAQLNVAGSGAGQADHQVRPRLQEASVRHLRVPSCQPERHHLRATGRLQRGQSDDDAQRLRSRPQPAGRYADVVGDSESERTTQAYNIYRNCIISGPAGGPGDFTLSSITNGNARGNNQSVSETDTGGWFMADFQQPRCSARPARQRGRTLRWKPRCQRPAIRPPMPAAPEVTVDNKYSDWLPS